MVLLGKILFGMVLFGKMLSTQWRSPSLNKETRRHTNNKANVTLPESNDIGFY
jgi:hypothetical protein